MIDLRQSRVFKRVIVAIYWVAVPILALSFIGSIFTLGGPLPAWQKVASVGGIAALTLLLGWRLWLYRRALGIAGAPPTGGRLLRVFLPLGILAIAGFLISLLGLVWLVLGIGFAREITAGDQSPAGLAAIGFVVAVVGGLMTVPFFRALSRRPVAAESDKTAQEVFD